tara:strand:+ start:297 stop:410 length:114 start_codon:yes stop_codon:yes gene_type:complete
MKTFFLIAFFFPQLGQAVLIVNSPWWINMTNPPLLCG